MYLKFYSPRNHFQLCPCLEGIASLHTVGGEALHCSSHTEEGWTSVFFLAAAMLLWLMVDSQLWGLQPVVESLFMLCVLLCTHSSEAWKFSLAATIWVHHCCAHEPVTLVPPFMFLDPICLFWGRGRDRRRGWQKQTGVNFGNMTLSFVSFSVVFYSTTAPGSSGPLSWGSLPLCTFTP